MSRLPDIRKAKLVDFLKEPIELLDYYDDGRDGVVYKGRFKRGPSIEIAVKFYIPNTITSLFSQPSKLPYFAEELRRRYEHELLHMRSVSHPNLQKYVSCGILLYEKKYFQDRCPTLELDTTIPFIVSRFVRGKRLDRLLQQYERDVSRASLIDSLVGVAKGLSHLHEQKVLHGDVRPENVMIEELTGTPILLDFGLAKNFSIDQRRYTRLYFDPDPLPYQVKKVLKEVEEEEGFRYEALRNILFPCYDLYCFSLLIQEVLESLATSVLQAFDRDYLAEIVDALRSWELTSSSNDPPATAMTGLVRTSEDLVEKLGRLTAGPDFFRRELHQREKAPSRIIMRQSGSVEIRESVAPFVSHPGLRRLYNINQLALVQYIYPSASQSRFDHSLSALGRAQQIWRALSFRPKFLFHMGLEDIDRLELIALHHDVNHFPFLHYFQEAGIPSVDRASVLKPLTAISAELNQDTIQKQETEPPPTLENLLTGRGIELDYLRTLLDRAYAPTRYDVPDQIIKSIINSGVDMDKLAYLPDDAGFSGLPFGRGVDIDGLLDGIDVARVSLPDGQKIWHVVFSYEALPAVESVCFARYWNFQRLYWHHTNRAMASMVIWTVREIYSSGDESPQTYLNATRNMGEAGALQYLSNIYRQRFRQPAPIEGLATSRDRIYKRIFEISFTGKEFEAVLDSFQDTTELGATKRQEAQKSVFQVVAKFTRDNGFKGEIRPSEVLLDIPLRKMDLGGPIFVRGINGEIKPATEVSYVLRELEHNFSAMSKVLRTFISPELRDGLGAHVWISAIKLRADIAKAVRGEEIETEVV